MLTPRTVSIEEPDSGMISMASLQKSSQGKDDKIIKISKAKKISKDQRKGNLD